MPRRISIAFFLASFACFLASLSAICSGVKGSGFEPVVPSMSVKVLVGFEKIQERAGIMAGIPGTVQIIVGGADLYNIPAVADAAPVSGDKPAGNTGHAHHAV